MKKLQEKLDFLLNKYSVENSVKLKDNKTVIIDGKEVPTLSHRNERRFIELKNIVNNGTLVGVNVMRVARIVEAGKDIHEELYREFDICQFVLQRKIKSVTVMENGNVLNAIATTEDGVVCTIGYTWCCFGERKFAHATNFVSTIIDEYIFHGFVIVFPKVNRD